MCPKFVNFLNCPKDFWDQFWLGCLPCRLKCRNCCLESVLDGLNSFHCLCSLSGITDETEARRTLFSNMTCCKCLGILIVLLGELIINLNIRGTYLISNIQFIHEYVLHASGMVAAQHFFVHALWMPGFISLIQSMGFTNCYR